MNNHTKRWFGRVFWGFIGICLLYVAGRFLVTEYHLRQYEKIFSQVAHPQGTSLVDNISLRFSYYPATYADDSIGFKSAYLIGELRSYRGDWKDISDFHAYLSRARDPSTLGRILVFPVYVEQRRISVDTESGFASGLGYAFDPFTADPLSAIDEHYRYQTKPKQLEEPEQRLYLVYSVWR